MPALLLGFLLLGSLGAAPGVAGLGMAKLELDSSLEVGEDLEIVVKNGQPFSIYRAHLLDEFSSIIAEIYITTDSKGRGSAVLWLGTGVVGCGCSDPWNYRFESYLEATTHLVGRRFTVELFAPGGYLEDLEDVDLVVSATEIFFWSPLAGCADAYYEPEETIFLTGLNPPASVEIYTVYLIEAPEEELTIGMELAEVRAAFAEKPQQVEIADGIESFTEQITAGDELPPGPYTAILRPEESSDFTLTESSRTTRVFYIGRTQEHCSWSKGEEPPSP